MSVDPYPEQAEWQRMQRAALVIGVAGLALCAVGAFLHPKGFFPGYLVGFNFWLAITLGSLAIWMIHNLTGGYWGLVIQRWLEAASRTLPLLVLFFVPVALGVNYLYIWADPPPLTAEETRPTTSAKPAQPQLQGTTTDREASERKELAELLHKKEGYLNVPFFLVRAAIYFTVWLVVAFLLNYWSGLLDRQDDPQVARRMQNFSGPGLVLYGLTMTFAAVDWVMSLEPKWYSTIFGVLVAAGQLLPAFGLAVCGTGWLARRKPLADVVTPQIWNDLGNLLLAFVMIWAYMSFSQLMLIWSGNLPEEIVWYKARSEGGWQVVATVLAVFYFGLPFVLLLSRDIKRQPRRLLVVAGLLVGISLVNQYWMVIPAFSPGRIAFNWAAIPAVVGLGGIWVAVFLWQLQARPLLPVHDPLREEAANHV